jgi:DNA-binding phage protein
MTRSTPYQDILNKRLQDPEQAAAYLNAAIEADDVDLFLLALKNVAAAQGTDLTDLSQTYPSLELQNILRLLSDAGLIFAIRDDRKAS